MKELYIEKWRPEKEERESVKYKRLRFFYDIETGICVYEREINYDLKIGESYNFTYEDYDDCDTYTYLVLKRENNVYYLTPYYPNHDNGIKATEEKYLGDCYIKCNVNEVLGIDLELWNNEIIKRKNIISQLKEYEAWNEQEEKDVQEIVRRLESGEELYYRDNNSAHITVSAWVTNQEKDKILMAYHKIYDSWAWLGGHADGDHDLLAVALKEVKEESGLESVRPLSNNIFSVEIATVDGHMKNGKYVSSHLHLNVTYLLEANPNDPIHNKPDENLDVRWFELDQAVIASTESWYQKNVYMKLNEKLRKVKENRIESIVEIGRTEGNC